jgi:predicted membrane protein
MNQMNAVVTPQSYFFKDQFNIIISIYIQVFLVALSFWLSHQTLYAYLFSSVHVTCSAFLILDVRVLIILGLEHKLRNSSLKGFLQPHVIFHFSTVTVFFSAPFSNISSRNVRDKEDPFAFNPENGDMRPMLKH